MLNPAHHYCDVYDSLQQKENVKWGDPLNKYYLGRLRLDTLLARKTIIKDAELLNGRFFLSVTETEDLFKNMPLKKIEIRARSANLEHALVKLFAPPGADTLRGIILQSLPDEEATAVRKKLEKIPSSRVTNRKSLCRVLEEAGIDRTHVDRLDQAWSTWIDLSTRGELNIATWRKFDFNFKTELTERLDQTKHDTFDSLETDHGRELARLLYDDKVRADRGKVVEHVKEAKGQATGEELKDIATLSSWHSAAYNRSVAVHHDCGMVEITDDPGNRPIGVFKLFDQIKERLRFRTASNIPAANISPAFLEALSRYSKSEYDGLIERHEDNLNEWHNNPDASPRLAQAINELVEGVDRVPFRDDRSIPGWFAGPLKIVCRWTAHKAIDRVPWGLLEIILQDEITKEITKEVIDSKINQGIDKMLPDKLASVSRRIVERATDLK